MGEDSVNTLLSHSLKLFRAEASIILYFQVNMRYSEHISVYVRKNQEVSKHNLFFFMVYFTLTNSEFFDHQTLQ